MKLHHVKNFYHCIISHTDSASIRVLNQPPTKKGKTMYAEIVEKTSCEFGNVIWTIIDGQEYGINETFDSSTLQTPGSTMSLSDDDINNLTESIKQAWIINNTVELTGADYVNGNIWSEGGYFRHYPIIIYYYISKQSLALGFDNIEWSNNIDKIVLNENEIEIERLDTAKKITGLDI